MSGGSSYNTSNKLVFSGLGAGAGAGAGGSSASLRSVQSPSLESHSISINKDLLVKDGLDVIRGLMESVFGNKNGLFIPVDFFLDEQYMRVLDSNILSQIKDVDFTLSPDEIKILLSEGRVLYYLFLIYMKKMNLNQ